MHLGAQKKNQHRVPFNCIHTHIYRRVYVCTRGIFNFSNRFAADTHDRRMHEREKSTNAQLVSRGHVHRTYTYSNDRHVYIYTHTHPHTHTHTRACTNTQTWYTWNRLYLLHREYDTSRVEVNLKRRRRTDREWSRIDVTYIYTYIHIYIYTHIYARGNSQNAATYVRVYAKLGRFWRFEFRVREIAW